MTGRTVFNASIKSVVWNKTNGMCWYCGVPLDPFLTYTIDHVSPLSLGGTNDLDNLVPSCRSCNSSKGDLQAPRITTSIHSAPYQVPARPLTLSSDEIKDFRLRRGLTQSQFSSIIGVSLPTVRSWEQGTRHPANEMAWKISFMSLHPGERSRLCASRLSEAISRHDELSLALDIEGDRESADRSRAMAAKIHSMATAHEDAGKIDPTNDPVQVMYTDYADH